MLSIVLTAFEIYFEAMTMTFIENSAVKVLSSKTIRKDLQLMFLLLNVVQSIFFCPKYMINKDVISPNTQKSLLIPIIAVVVFMALYFYRNYIIFFYDGYSKYSVNVRIFLGIFEAFFYSARFLINIVVAVTQTKKNIALVLTKKT